MHKNAKFLVDNTMVSFVEKTISCVPIDDDIEDIV